MKKDNRKLNICDGGIVELIQEKEENGSNPPFLSLKCEIFVAQSFSYKESVSLGPEFTVHNYYYVDEER